jgi:hypothetical protein
MGDLLFGDCRWYSSDFYSAGCKAALLTVKQDRIQGTIDCGTIGVNCPSGTGILTRTGACGDGERYEPLTGLKATFELTEPLTLEQIEAAESPPGEEIVSPR